MFVYKDFLTYTIYLLWASSCSMSSSLLISDILFEDADDEAESF